MIARMGGRLWLIAFVIAGTALACRSDDTFECQTYDQCACRGGMCQTTGYCSFPDEACASGQRYGGLAGGLSNQCVVDDGTPTSAGGSTSNAGSASGVGPTDDTGPVATTGDEGSASSVDPSGETGSTSTTGGNPGCWFEGFEDDLLDSTWAAWVDPGVQVSMNAGEAEIALAETPGYGGIGTTFTLDLRSRTVTWAFDTLPELDQGEAYEAVLVDQAGDLRVEIGFGAVAGYWDPQGEPLTQLFSEPAPPGDLMLVQLVNAAGSLTLTVVDDDDEATDVATFDAPTGWNAAAQRLEFRAGASLAENIPGTLKVDYVSVCP